MKQLKKWFFQLFIFSLVSAIVLPRAYTATEAPNQESPPQEVAAQGIPVLVGANIEATITLAELQEILIKIEEDLSERIYHLEYADCQDMITMLNERKQSVIRQLKKLQGFDEKTVALYLLHSRKEKDGTFVWWSGAAIVGIAIGAIVMASVDSQGEMHWPTLDRLKFNSMNNRVVNFCGFMLCEIMHGFSNKV